MATTKVVLEGPLFDGQADEAAAKFCGDLTKQIGLIGQTFIKLDTERMDKSGRGGTGRAADGVKLTGAGTSYVISGGIREGEYAWPWLEGTSKRNSSAGFKGYKSFRRTRLRMRKQVTPYAQAMLERYLSEMGGGEE